MDFPLYGGNNRGALTQFQEPSGLGSQIQGLFNPHRCTGVERPESSDPISVGTTRNNLVSVSCAEGSWTVLIPCSSSPPLPLRPQHIQYSTFHQSFAFPTSLYFNIILQQRILIIIYIQTTSNFTLKTKLLFSAKLRFKLRICCAAIILWYVI